MILWIKIGVISNIRMNNLRKSEMNESYCGFFMNDTLDKNQMCNNRRESELRNK